MHGSKAPAFVAGWLLFFCATLPPILLQLGAVYGLGLAPDHPTFLERWAAAAEGPVLNLVMGILSLPFSALMYAGWTRFGLIGSIRRLPPDASDIWPRRSFVPVLAVIAMISGPAFFSGFSPAFGLPALALWLLGFLSIPLVIDRGLRPHVALGMALKLVVRNVLPLIVIALAVSASYFLIVVNFGLFVLWWVPWTVHIVAVMYEDLCGIAADEEDIARL